MRSFLLCMGLISALGSVDCFAAPCPEMLKILTFELSREINIPITDTNRDQLLKMELIQDLTHAAQSIPAWMPSIVLTIVAKSKYKSAISKHLNLSPKDPQLPRFKKMRLVRGKLEFNGRVSEAYSRSIVISRREHILDVLSQFYSSLGRGGLVNSAFKADLVK